MQIYIEGVDFDVLQDDPVLLDNRVCNGMIDFMKAKIIISEALSANNKLVTLFHEIIHGILQARGLEDENDNENLVDHLARGLVITLRQSPKLRELLVDSNLWDEMVNEE